MAEIYIGLSLCGLSTCLAGFALWRVLTLPTNAAMQRSFDDLIGHVDGMASKLNSIARANVALEEDVEAQLDQITTRLARVKQRESNEKRRSGAAPVEDPELTLDEQRDRMELALVQNGRL